MNQPPSAAQRMAADCLCFRARRVSRALTRMYDESLRPLGIQATQLTLLNAIAMCGEQATMSRLSDILAMDGTTLSRNLRPLETSGHIAITRLPGDRRVRLAALTEQGRRLVDDALPLWTEAHGRVVAALGEEQAGTLKRCFDDAVAAATAIPTAAPG